MGHDWVVRISIMKNNNNFATIIKTGSIFEPLISLCVLIFINNITGLNFIYSSINSDA